MDVFLTSYQIVPVGNYQTKDIMVFQIRGWRYPSKLFDSNAFYQRKSAKTEARKGLLGMV